MRQIKIGTSITKRDTASLEVYLREIGKIPLLTQREEDELAKKIKDSFRTSSKGDSEAISKLAKHNLRFVVSIAKQYQHKGMNLNDLINEGNLGLVRAAQLFDESRGFKFISYAVWWVRQSMLHALAENTRAVRLPANRVSLVNRMQVASGDFIMKYEREPTNEELAELIKAQPEDMDAFSVYLFPTLSLSSPIQKLGIDAESSLEEILPSDAPAPDHALSHNESLRICLKQAIGLLNKQQQDVVNGFFGLNGTEKTLDDLASELNLTKERIRQIKDRALMRLSTPKVKKMLVSQ